MTPDFIQTYTGKKFSFNNLNIENIDILDIAHALSNICRFNGHCNKFYSVAEHSIYVSRYCPNNLKLWGLLDDASETYMGDMTRPLKQYMYEFQELEIQIMDTIILKFGLTPGLRPDEVIEIDNRILATEKEQLTRETKYNWELNYLSISGLEIRGLSPELAEKEFLNVYYGLINE